MVNLQEEKCAYDKFYGNRLDYKKYLKTFVEMLVVRSIIRSNPSQNTKEWSAFS